MVKYKGITITWLGHDGFLFEHDRTRMCIDPYQSSSSTGPATIILVTHEHSDHCNPEDIARFATSATTIVCTEACRQKLAGIPGKIVTLHPGQETKIGDNKVTAVPAYNLDKFRDPATKTVFHPKQDAKNGYIVEIARVRIYHAGDTDNIPEMEEISCDIALLPVSGTYVMTAEEAADAAQRLRPKVAIPMHYGTIVGSDADARRFKELLAGSTIKVELLEKVWSASRFLAP